MAGNIINEELDEDNFKDVNWGGKQLRRIGIFENLTDQELRELYSLGEIRVHKAKSNVVIEGETSRGMFLLLKGTVSVFKTDKATNTLIRLAFLEQGAIFGELSLFDNAPRSATITAESVCHAFVLGVDIFDAHLTKKGDNLKTRFYKKCAEEMAARFRVQNEDYVAAQLLIWRYALRKDAPKEAVASPAG